MTWIMTLQNGKIKIHRIIVSKLVASTQGNIFHKTSLISRRADDLETNQILNQASWNYIYMHFYVRSSWCLLLVSYEHDLTFISDN